MAVTEIRSLFVVLLLLLLFIQTKVCISFEMIKIQSKRVNLSTKTQIFTDASSDISVQKLSSTTTSTTDNTKQKSNLETFVADNFDAFYKLLSLNEGIWKKLSESDNGCTIFVPTNVVFDSVLTKKQLLQLQDDRNLETVQKIGLYHVIENEAVSAVRLRTEDWTIPAPSDGSPRPITVQALKTMGGEVPVGRSKSGGTIFGWGAKEDGDIVIGPNAHITRSYKIDGCAIHEVDALISPILLWRYMDQLRIPGF